MTTPAPAPPTADSPMTDIHDIKPLLEIGSSWPWWMIAAAVVVVVGLALLAWWLWRRRKPKASARTQIPLLSPEAEAYGQLDLLASGVHTEVRLFYFQLSAIVRRYLERRFRIPAVEMTTEELLPKIDQLPLNSDLVSPLKAFCRAADPIKYAGAAATRERLPQDLAFARDLVRRTTPSAAMTENDPEPQAAAVENSLEPLPVVVKKINP